MAAIKIPLTVDNPPYLLLWSVDEMAPPLLGLCIGVLLGKAFLCVAIGFLAMKLYRRFRDNNPDGYFLHALYQCGFVGGKSYSMINPFIKRLYP
jgi:conjugal transfer pilus assembly protein TraL